ncbi:unnamed protein product [Pedinophyceae sp. YPF-701]|nr:unnamed protein product [Pedinophyceae sp. YPF-701]
MLAAKIERDVEVASSATAPPASPRKSDGPGPGTKNAKKRKRERGGTEAAQAAERDEGPAPPRAPGAGTDDASARDDASGSCSPHGGPLGVRLFRRTAPGKVFRVSEGGMTFVPGAAPDSYRDARADLASPRRGGRTWAAEFRPVEPPRAEAKQRLRACAVDPAALLARAERGGYDAKQPGGVLAAGRRAEGSVVRDGRCGDVEYGPRRHGVAGGAGAAKLLGL